MKPHVSIRLGLVFALALTSGVVTGAQSNWPTARPALTLGAAAPRPTTVRTPRPKASRRRATIRRVETRPVEAQTMESDLLRSLTELATRQAAAIEALVKRLEAAESRVAQSAPAPQVPAAVEIEEAQVPFRAALSIDWADVIGR